MSLLYPGIDDEDAMRWYENIHSMPQSTQAPPTTDLPLDNHWQNQQFNGGANMWRDSILDPDYRIEYDSGDMRLHGSDPGPFYAIDDPTHLKEVGGFDMKTAEGYESYLKSLSPTTEASPLSIAYDSYSAEGYEAYT